MNFLYPAFLLGALAIAIPIALHLLRRDVAPDLPFTAVRLIKKSPVERSRRRRLRDVVLLVTRVAALLLLAAAFARPFAPSAAAAMQPLTIVGIDRSFSMGAPGRFERALQLARTAIDETGFGDRVAVIAFDDRAEVLALPGAAADARASLAALATRSGGTRFSSVINKASELASGGAARLIIISDLQRAGWDGQSRLAVPASLKVEVRDAGATPGNAAVVGARVTSKRYCGVDPERCGGGAAGDADAEPRRNRSRSCALYRPGLRHRGRAARLGTHSRRRHTLDSGRGWFHGRQCAAPGDRWHRIVSGAGGHFPGFDRLLPGARARSGPRRRGLAASPSPHFAGADRRRTGRGCGRLPGRRAALDSQSGPIGT